MKTIQYRGAPIASIASLARALSVTTAELQSAAHPKADLYGRFELPKRNGKGMRPITTPKPMLKALHNKINTKIFSLCSFPAYLQGSIRDKTCPRDFLSNALMHSRSSTLITLDIENFYTSIRAQHVFKIFKYLFCFPDDVSEMLTRIVVDGDSVPQGAPTSSYIANMIFFHAEPKLVRELAEAGFVYSRLLDDITVSHCDAPLSIKRREFVFKKIKAMLKEVHLKMHPDKTNIDVIKSGNRSARVTGLDVSAAGVGIARNIRDNIRAEVKKCEYWHLENQQTTLEYHQLHNSVRGKVTLLKRLNYKAADSLNARLSSCLPIYDEKKGRKIKRSVIDLAGRLTPTNTSNYKKRYNILIYCLTVLARTQPNVSAVLSQRLRAAMSANLASGKS